MRSIAGVVSVLAHGLVLGGLSARAPRVRPPEPALDVRTIELIELPESAQGETVSEPEPEPEPEPESEPEPEPAPEPAPEPEPLPREPKPQPQPRPAPEPIPAAPAGPSDGGVTVPPPSPSGDDAPAGSDGEPSDVPPTKARKLGGRYSSKDRPRSKARAAGSCTEPASKPIPLQKVAPKFPAAALRSDIVGRLVLRASVDRNGAVTRVVVVESPGTAVEGPAKDAFAQWRFEPALACGKPVAATYAKAWKFKGGR
jgi:TonB family protein